METPRAPIVGASSEILSPLCSIGHSNVAIDVLIGLLHRHNVEVIADVRTYPRSQFVPHFDGSTLRRSLSDVGIDYVFLGAELGGRPDGDQFYDTAGHVLYDRLAQSEIFLAGLDRLIRGAEKYRVAMLCSEEDPSRCHRHLLIGRVLTSRDIDVSHIRGNGHVQSEVDLSSSTYLRESQSQSVLFDAPTEEPQWKSVQSVLQKKRQPSSSAR